MSPSDERDERDPDQPAGDAAEQPDAGRPDVGSPGYAGDSGDFEDTAPIWAGSEEEAPAYDPQAGDPQAGQQWGDHQGQQDRAGDPWPTAAYPAYGPGYGAGNPQGYPQHPGYPTQHQAQAGRVPGWLWPVVAAMALMVGLLGGTLGGVAVSRSLNGGTGVNIPVIETERGPAPPLQADNGSIAAVAAHLLPSTVQILAGTGGAGEQGGGATGSGFVFDGKGHVITNNHVVADATDAGELIVVDHKGREYDARIVGRSPVYDVAVLKVSGAEQLQPAALGSSQSMRVGESVVAIGSPLGLSSTVTSGIVSAVDRPVTTGSATGAADQSSYINAVQTDAAINPGNSGGPLVNMRGEVVGVNSAIATMGGGLGGEAGNIGVGFAIPMEQVRVTAAQILATGQARYPVIGATVDTGGRTDGAEIVGVDSGTPAAKAGLREGDLVVGLEDKQITDGIGLIVAIRTYQPGEEITLTVNRDGTERRVKVTLDAKTG